VSGKKLPFIDQGKYTFEVRPRGRRNQLVIEKDLKVRSPELTTVNNGETRAQFGEEGKDTRVALCPVAVPIDFFPVSVGRK